MAGIDGARGGWVVVTVSATPDGTSQADVRFVSDLHDVIRRLDSGALAAAAIDIPIGLAARDPRPADIEARRRLGPRRSSVFPAPARAVLGATTYEEACALSRAASGKAISKQLFNILPKIREVDALVTPLLQERLFEMSPELSLTLLAGAPMVYPKTTAEGRAERVHALAALFGHAQIDHHVGTPPKGARADDVLDAFAGAWTARRHAAGDSLRLGGQVDERGLRMEVLA